jgi:DNA-directed RNA polymerase subunit RPC12/RpoP
MLVMMYKCGNCDTLFAIDLRDVMNNSPESCPMCKEDYSVAYAVARVTPTEKPTA